MPNDDIKRMPIKDLRQEEGADELATSEAMEPYLEFATAVMLDADPTPELEAIRQLPIEKRYVWRIASALKWGFARGFIPARIGEVKMASPPSPRQNRILSGLMRGDLVFEVPQESYFAQFEEASGHQSRVPVKVLLEMHEHGWIRRVPQGPQKCDYWEITDQGRKAILGTAGKLHNHQ